MSDWQVGDLALCVRTFPRSGVKSGRVLTVERVTMGRTMLGLCFVEHPVDNPLGLAAMFFRKVTPPAADEFDRETITLMSRVEQPA